MLLQLIDGETLSRCLLILASCCAEDRNRGHQQSRAHGESRWSTYRPLGFVVVGVYTAQENGPNMIKMVIDQAEPDL